MINAEEAASSNEEIETLNEEMQATNEELETLNEELQATVEELNTTNDELEARSAELEAANIAKQAQVDKALAERRAVSAALDSLVPPYAIVNGKGELQHVSAQLASLDARERGKDGWWRTASDVNVNGTRYRTEIRPLDGQLVLIVFHAK